VLLGVPRRHCSQGAERWPNLTLKKIPKMVLARCEWGHDDYSLNVANLPMAQPEKAASAGQRRATTKARARPAAPIRARAACLGERSMNARVLHAVTGRLSLRPPQAESLTKLVRRSRPRPTCWSMSVMWRPSCPR
jgi:hypothetical protein